MGNTQKPKQKSSISVITMVQLDILDLIVTSDQLLKKAIA